MAAEEGSQGSVVLLLALGTQPLCVVHEGSLQRPKDFMSLVHICYHIGFMYYLIKQMPLLFSLVYNLVKYLSLSLKILIDFFLLYTTIFECTLFLNCLK